MKSIPTFSACILSLALLHSACTQPPTQGSAAGAGGAVETAKASGELLTDSMGKESVQVVEAGQDFRAYARMIERETPQGVVVETNRITAIGTGINYFDDGRWKASEAVIEPFAEGAVARRGPMKGIFSASLAAPALFDVEGPRGERMRGGVRALQVTDVAAGRNVTVATVNPEARGELLPPNQIVFRCRHALNSVLIYLGIEVCCMTSTSIVSLDLALALGRGTKSNLWTG